MTCHHRVPSGRSTLGALLVCLGAGAVASVLLGQDANWDLRNYHLYNPYAWLSGRVGVDLLPAGVQSTFNPLLDVPYYLLATGWLASAPRALAAVAGLPFGALLFATLRLAGWVLDHPGGAGRLLPWLTAAMAGTAAATQSEIGTTFNDIPVAALLLGAFVLAAPRSGALGGAHWGAGAMLGAAVALKPSAAVFAPGAVAGLMLLGQGWRARVRIGLCLGAGGLAAGVVLAGPWALTLWRLYGSPMFPLMNAAFRAEWWPPTNLLDTRFLPRTVLQALFYPFYWLTGQPMLVAEPAFRDARLALAMLALPALGAAALRGRLAAPRRVLATVVMAALGYALWLRGFSILRYALVLEALAATLIVVAVRTLAEWAMPARRLAAPVLAGLLLGVLVWTTEPPDWWRVPYGPRVFTFDRVALPPGSLVLTMGEPVAIALPFLDAPGYSAIGLTGHILATRGYRLFTEIEDRISRHDGPLFALTDEVGHAVGIAPSFGLQVDESSCQRIKNNILFNGMILVCALERQSNSNANTLRSKN